MGASQEQLPGMENLEFTENLDRKVAFGGFVKEHIYDPAGELSGVELSESEQGWFTAEKIESLLFSDERGSRQIDPSPVGYAKGVLLPPREFTWVKRPPQFLARSVARTTLSAAMDIDDESIARSKRSRVHALESTSNAIAKHKEGLDERYRDISLLLKESTAPGFAHQSAREMKRLIGQSWAELLNILDTLKIHRTWDDEKTLKAKAAAVRYLNSGGQNIRVGNWQKIIKLEKNYLNARRGLIGQSLRVHEKELNTFRAEIEPKNEDK